MNEWSMVHWSVSSRWVGLWWSGHDHFGSVSIPWVSESVRVGDWLVADQ